VTTIKADDETKVATDEDIKRIDAWPSDAMMALISPESCRTHADIEHIATFAYTLAIRMACEREKSVALLEMADQLLKPEPEPVDPEAN